MDMNDLIDKMERLEANPDKPRKRRHVDADTILLEALIAVTKDTPDAFSVTRLLAHYERIGKWYA